MPRAVFRAVSARLPASRAARSGPLHSSRPRHPAESAGVFRTAQTSVRQTEPNTAHGEQTASPPRFRRKRSGRFVALAPARWKPPSCWEQDCVPAACQSSPPPACPPPRGAQETCTCGPTEKQHQSNNDEKSSSQKQKTIDDVMNFISTKI